MELRHLRYFVQIAEEQHSGRAAERLRVAQPALSRQIQDLEEEIGFKLFHRLPRGVKLSAAGKLFMVDARRILQQVNEATARAKRVAAVNPERCEWDSSKVSPGTAPFPIRSDNFASDNRTWNYNSSRPAPWNKLKPFNQADWMPASCLRLPISVANWRNSPSPPST